MNVSASTPISRRQSVERLKPSDLGPGAADGDRSRLEASPWEREGYRKVWARLRVCRAIRVARKRVHQPVTSRTIGIWPDIAAAAMAAIAHDGEIITHAPNLMCGSPIDVQVFKLDDRLGLDPQPPYEHWNGECDDWHVCKRGDRFARRAADLHGACRAVLLDPRPALARGLALRMASRLPVTVGPLDQPDQVLGHPAVLRLRRRAPGQAASPMRFNRIAEGTDHPWSHLPQHGGAAGRSSATTSDSTMASGSSTRTAT